MFYFIRISTDKVLISFYYSFRYHYKYDIRDQHDELYRTEYKIFKLKRKTFSQIPGGYPRPKIFEVRFQRFSLYKTSQMGTLINIQMLSNSIFMKNGEITDPSRTIK